MDVTSLLLQSVESQEDVSVQDPWDLVSSRRWDLLDELKQSISEDRQGVVSLHVLSHYRVIFGKIYNTRPPIVARDRFNLVWTSHSLV